MVSTYFRPAVLVTAVLSLAQSIAWFVISLLGVLAYRCDLVPDADSDKISRFLTFLYFQGPGCTLDLPANSDWMKLAQKISASPIYIHGWMCAYLTLDITYFIISIALLIELCRSKNGGFSLFTMRLWCANTFAFLVMDLWLTIVWGMDYGELTNYLGKVDTTGIYSWTTTIPGALMAIAARGFILYVVNLVFFIYFMVQSFNWRILFSTRCCVVQEDTTSSRKTLTRSHTDPDLAYGSRNSIPRVGSEWDNGRALVPVTSRWNEPRPNAHEGVTSFNNNWYGDNPKSPKKFWDEDMRQEGRSLGRRPPSPPMRHNRQDREEQAFQQGVGRPSIRSNFEYPDRRNFEQGGARAGKSLGRHQELY